MFKENHPLSKSVGLPTSVSLPAIPNKSSALLKTLSGEDLISPTPEDRVNTWFLVPIETKKNVQFERNFDSNRTEKIPSETEIVDSTRRNDSNLHLTSLSEVKLQRTTSPKPSSISSSSTTTSSLTRHSSFISQPSVVRFRTQSIEMSNHFIVGPSILRERPSNLTLLEINTALPEHFQKKLQEIRQSIPDEFERLVPTLLKLGIILWPKQWFNKDHELTGKELRQRQCFISILEQDQENEREQRRLSRLYAGLTNANENFQKQNLLRDNLSLQGQLSLLAAYRDEIERQLTKCVRYWKSIPMQSVRISLSSEASNSTLPSSASELPRSIILPRLNSVSMRKTAANNFRLTRDEIFPLSFPDELDQHWQRKLLGKLVEQGMKILDKTKNLSNATGANDFKEQELVREFKRWIFLWFSLFDDEEF